MRLFQCNHYQPQHHNGDEYDDGGDDDGGDDDGGDDDGGGGDGGYNVGEVCDEKGEEAATRCDTACQEQPGPGPHATVGRN